MTPLRFSGFPFFGDFRAPGLLRADSSEKFSTERPVFVASPAPMFCKLGTEDFLLTSLANSKVQIWGKKGREKIKVLLVLIWGEKKGKKS